VPYGTYILNITRTGYISTQSTLVIDDETIELSATLTPIPHDPSELDLGEYYTFTVTGQTTPNYKMTSSILSWLQDNLKGLKDDNNKPLFGKVNCGYNESTLKSFGKKPVADVYINKVEYTDDFERNTPESVHSIIICHLKGVNNNAYEKATEVHDLLMQEFIEKESFRCLDKIVRSSHITNSEFVNPPTSKKWGVIVAFEIKHILY